MDAILKSAPQKANFSNIARHLMEGITSKHFAVGALLPTELELCKQYGTSRHTVRAALTELQQLGLVVRRKNVGTRVVSAKPRPSFRPSLASLDDLVQFGEEHLRVVQAIEQETAKGELAKELGCAEGTPWLRISSLRMVGDQSALPIGWTDVYIDARYTDIEKLVGKSPDALISSLIEERYGRQIAEIQQDVRAFVIADGPLARKLQVEPGSSALKIVRSYFDTEGEVFEVSVSVHPADRFSVSMRLRR